jgi:hypothetical protein
MGWPVSINMDLPPKIIEPPLAREVPIEVLPPEHDSADLPPRNQPIHALSALILAAVDSLWAIFDWVPPVWIVAIPFCFAAVFIPVYLIQKNLRHDTKEKAITIAVLLGVLAALPLPIFGTPVGLGLLAWSGLNRILPSNFLRPHSKGKTT